MSELPNIGDEFDRITAELEQQIVDPIIDKVRAAAWQLDCDLVRVAASERAETMERNIREIEAMWPYRGMNVRVSGRLGVPTQSGYAQAQLDERTLRSRGFRYMTVEFQDALDEGLPVVMDRIYYEFEAENTDSEGGSAIVIGLPEHLESFQLPFCSPELRVRRFQYDHPTDAAYIDELAFRAGTADQAILEFGQYYFDIDPTQETNDGEAAKDAAAFLRDRAKLEQLANYQLSFMGDIIVVNKQGDGVPGVLTKPKSGLAHIRDIILHPLNTTTTAVHEGSHTLVPYIDVVLFDRRGPGRDRQLLIPCSSLLSIRSARYQE